MKAVEKKIIAQAIKDQGAEELMRNAQEISAELIQAISRYHRAQMNAEIGESEKDLSGNAEKVLVGKIAAASVALDILRSIVPGEHDQARAAHLAKMAGQLTGPR